MWGLALAVACFAGANSKNEVTENFFTSDDVTENNVTMTTSPEFSEEPEEPETADGGLSPLQAFIQAGRSYTMYRAGVAIHLYYLPFLILLGFLGNSISLAVMTRPGNRQISCCVYMAALAVSDNINLFVAAYYWCVTMMPPPVGRPLFQVECQIFAWISQDFQLYGMTLIISMTMDRVIAIKAPLKAASICTPERAKRFVAILPLLTTLFTVPYFTHSAISPDGSLCASLSRKSLFSQVYSWVNICVSCFVPFTALLVMNTIIILAMLRRGSYFSTAGGAGAGEGDDGQQKRNLEQEKRTAENRQLTIMLLLVTFAFLFLSLPQYLRYITYTFITYLGHPRDYAIYVLAVHVSNKMYFSNNGVNFFLYCLGGTKFRHDMKQIICGRFVDAKKGQNSSAASNMTDLSSA